MLTANDNTIGRLWAELMGEKPCFLEETLVVAGFQEFLVESVVRRGRSAPSGSGTEWFRFFFGRGYIADWAMDLADLTDMGIDALEGWWHEAQRAEDAWASAPRFCSEDLCAMSEESIKSYLRYLLQKYTNACKLSWIQGSVVTTLEPRCEEQLRRINHQRSASFSLGRLTVGLNRRHHASAREPMIQLKRLARQHSSEETMRLAKEFQGQG